MQQRAQFSGINIGFAMGFNYKSLRHFLGESCDIP